MTEDNTSKGSDEIEELERAPQHPRVKNKKLRPDKLKHKRISTSAKYAAIIDLHHKGNTVPTIAEVTSMHTDTVRAIIKRFEPIFKELRAVEDYRSMKADLLSAAQITALKSALSESKLKKSSFLATLQGFKILNNAERLERGLSINNIAIGIGKVSGSHDE